MITPYHDNRIIFQSQSLEDRDLLEWFNGLAFGTYLEIGALDGVQFSNSYFFNRVLNWKGLLVELGPRNFKRLVKNRKDELAVVHAAVCDVEKDVHYWEGPNGGPVAGVAEFATTSFKTQWWKGKLNMTQQNRTDIIKCKPLRTIVKENIGNAAYFDFFSLDVEGSEYEVLRTLDFNDIGFGIILVECDDHNKLKNMAVRAFLLKNGYEYFDFHSRNCWFFNREFSSLYEHLLH